MAIDTPPLHCLLPLGAVVPLNTGGIIMPLIHEAGWSLPVASLSLSELTHTFLAGTTLKNISVWGPIIWCQTTHFPDDIPAKMNSECEFLIKI